MSVRRTASRSTGGSSRSRRSTESRAHPWNANGAMAGPCFDRCAAAAPRWMTSTRVRASGSALHEDALGPHQLDVARHLLQEIGWIRRSSIAIADETTHDDVRPSTRGSTPRLRRADDVHAARRRKRALPFGPVLIDPPTATPPFGQERRHGVGHSQALRAAAQQKHDEIATLKLFGVSRPGLGQHQPWRRGWLRRRRSRVGSADRDRS